MNLYSVPPLLTLINFAALAALAFTRGRASEVNRLFGGLCLLGCLLYIDILLVFNLESARTALWVSRIDHLFAVYLLPLYIHFFHAYLGLTGRRWLVRAAYAYALGLMLIVPTPWYIADMTRHPFGFFARGGPLYPLFGVEGLVVTLYVLVILYTAIRRSVDAERRNRLKYLFAGFGTMGLMNGLSALPILGYDIYPPGNFSFIPLVVFAVGLFKHDLLDTGRLLRKSLLYSVLSGGLTAVYALVLLAAERWLAGRTAVSSMALSLAFFFGVVVLLGPLKERLQGFIDRVFFRGRYDYPRTLKQVSREIAAVRDLDQIVGRLLETVQRTLEVVFCEIFVAGGGGRGFVSRGRCGLPGGGSHLAADNGLIVHLSRHPRIFSPSGAASADTGDTRSQARRVMATRNAALALPLVYNDRINAVMLLGQRRSGELFSAEDRDLLDTLASQSALALANARAYRLLAELNRNLERKVFQRTRALQRALTERERTQEQLIRSESLAAIGQLVAGTAHELNNPLSAVKSLLQSVADALRSPPAPAAGEGMLPLVADLEFADRELGRARDIVASLLDLSRQTQTYTEAVDLTAVVKDALRVLHNQYKRRPLRIATRFAEALPVIRGNFANLGQVVLNVVRNAIQAVGDGPGAILLTTGWDAAARQVVFTCRDTGAGVPEAVRRDIFKPFFTTKPVGQGTGLGLYLSHEIARRHRGSLSLRPDRPGTGACFELRLPLDSTGHSV